MQETGPHLEWQEAPENDMEGRNLERPLTSLPGWPLSCRLDHKREISAPLSSLSLASQVVSSFLSESNLLSQ